MRRFQDYKIRADSIVEKNSRLLEARSLHKLMPAPLQDLTEQSTCFGRSENAENKQIWTHKAPEREELFQLQIGLCVIRPVGLDR